MDRWIVDKLSAGVYRCVCVYVCMYVCGLSGAVYDNREI